MPEQQGLDSGVLARVDEYVKTIPPGIQAVLVVRHGYLVFERYYQNQTRNDYQMIRSATKSVISALIGIALHEGYIQSLDQTLPEFFPEHFFVDTDPCKREITLRNLLTLTAGFVPDQVAERIYGPPPEDWVKAALEAITFSQRGQLFAYSSIGVMLLGILLARKSRMNLLDFARQHLFEPLGIVMDEQAGFVWEQDHQGYYYGSGGLYLLPRDMAKFGYLYLNNGYWDGQQIVPAEYVRASTQPQSAGGFPEAAKYGYLWWVTEQQGHRAFFAAGKGGQYIYVIPDLDLVVTISSTVGEVTGVHHKDYILPLFVLAAIKA